MSILRKPGLVGCAIALAAFVAGAPEGQRIVWKYDDTDLHTFPDSHMSNEPPPRNAPHRVVVDSTATGQRGFEEVGMGKSNANEGEGSRSADRAYRKDTEEFVESGKVKGAAEKARKAVEGTEKAELDRAEEKGKEKARH